MLQMSVALIVFLFPLAFSPGPGNMFFAANGARFGLRETVSANTGYHVATWIVTAAIGFGFLAAKERYPGAFLVLKFLGALYVLWLAWKLIRAGVLKDDGKAQPATFMDGALLMVLNPKAYVIIALMFTQFLDGTDQNRIAMILVITTIFTLNNLVAFTSWAAAGDQMARAFRSPNGSQRMNLIFGGMLGAVGLWMLLS